MPNRTKQHLSNALVSELQRTPVDNITIQQLVSDCQLTRQTFYNHFNDIYDLVEWTVEQATAKSLEDNADYENWQQGFLNIMTTIQANQYLVQNAYQSVYRDLLAKYIYTILYRYIIAVVERQAVGMRVAAKHKHFIARFYSLAFIALIFEWVRDGMKEAPEEIVEQTGVLVQGDFKKALRKYATT